MTGLTMSNIKQVRPSKRKYKQGYINPDACKKLMESQKKIPIIYRSSYEKEFIYWLETSPKIISWASECLAIPYINKLDNKTHRYYPDFIVTTIDNQTILIEIKPKSQTVPPPSDFDPNSYAWKEYIKNRCKWAAALEFCKNNNMSFKILTEETISKMH